MLIYVQAKSKYSYLNALEKLLGVCLWAKNIRAILRACARLTHFWACCTVLGVGVDCNFARAWQSVGQKTALPVSVHFISFYK